MELLLLSPLSRPDRSTLDLWTFSVLRVTRERFFSIPPPVPAYSGDKPENYSQLGKENQHYADIAASIQTVTEEVLLGMARQIHKEFGVKRLCMAGGVALNSVAKEELCVKHQSRSCTSSLRPATVAAPSGPHSIPITPFWASHGNS